MAGHARFRVRSEEAPMMIDSSRASAPVCAPPVPAAFISVSNHPAALDADVAPLTDEERYRRFGEELDAIKQRVMKRVGPADVAYVRRLDRASRVLEVIGRVLIVISPGPVAWLVGVVALWLYKQVQATEIGHTALHGAYDRLPGAEVYASKGFRWDTPVDEESWRYAHNVRHHGNTNVAGRDPDVDFGPVRLTKQTPYERFHRWQVPFSLFLIFPFFAFVIGTHVTGLSEAIAPESKSLHFLPDRSLPSRLAALRKAVRKYAPYYLYNFVLFPVLAGPHWGKVLLANVLVEVLRDLYSACTIFCGHIGGDVASYPEGTRAHGRGQWYAMQIEATNNYEVSRPISILCGGLDRQIEHHLFPQLAPPRLREIAPEVRAACARWGIAYKTDSWGRTLRKAFAHLSALSRKGGVAEIVREMA